MDKEKGKGDFKSFNDKKMGKSAAPMKGKSTGDAMARRLAGKC